MGSRASYFGQDLTVLAVNKGTLMTTELEHEHKVQDGLTESQRREQRDTLEKMELLRSKIKLTRDVALPWRFHKFVTEIERDSVSQTTIPSLFRGC